MENTPQQIQSAKVTVKHILALIDEAENKFKSARNWGFLDIFGGGLIVDLIKHSRLNSASNIMNEISFYLRTLQEQLSNLSVPSDYRMKMGGFSSFADFVFDGAIFDIYMQGKIMQSLDEVRRLKYKLLELEKMLSGM